MFMSRIAKGRVAGRIAGCACGCGHSSKACHCGPSCPGCKCHHRKKKKQYSRRGGAEVNPAPAPDIPIDMRSIESKMISVWDDHGYYTGLVLLAKANKFSPAETNALVERLLDNQNHIAYLFMPKFNRTDADRIAQKLQEHIGLAGELIDALMVDKNSSESAAADVKWKQNADEIGSALYKLQNRFGPYLMSENGWKNQMQMHLQHLTKVVGAYLGGDRVQALKDMNPYIAHIRQLAMALAKLVSGSRFGLLPPAYVYPTSYQPYWQYRQVPTEEIILAPRRNPPYRFRTQTVYRS